MVACYFAYGSNMNPDRVRERGLDFTHLSGAALAGVTLVFDKTSRVHDGVGHANLVFAPGERAEGVLYWLGSVAEIQKMDRFESTPVNYSREVVRVTVAADRLPAELVTKSAGAGQSVEVTTWTYFANPAVRRAGLKPPRSYLTHLLAGRPYLSEDYYRKLAGWPCDETR